MRASSSSERAGEASEARFSSSWRTLLPPGGPDPELPRGRRGGAVDGVDLLTRGKQGHLEVVQTLEDGTGTMAVTLR